MYDKTVFKPASVTEIGRFSFAVASSDSSEDSSEDAADATSKSEAGSGTTSEENKSEFDFGDFNGLAPKSDDAVTSDKVDDLPSLDGPSLN